jgi:hypothetical protein
VGFDGDMAALGGQTMELNRARIAGLIATYHPRIVTLLTGIPDAAIGNTTMPQQLEALLRYIHRLDQTVVTLLLTTPVPTAPREDWAPAVIAFNAAMPSIAARRQAAGQHVTLVTLPPNVEEDRLGFHPSPHGYDQMASAILPAVRTALSENFPCAQRTRLAVDTTSPEHGTLRVTVTPRSPADALRTVRLGPASGVLPVTDLTVTERQATFTVVRRGEGAAMQRFVVTDDCGDWSSFVGGGPASF